MGGRPCPKRATRPKNANKRKHPERRREKRESVRPSDPKRAAGISLPLSTERKHAQNTLSRAKKRKGPPRRCGAAAPKEKTPAAPYSPAGEPCSTLGNAALNFRVRNGDGCFVRFVATGEKAQRGGNRERGVVRRRGGAPPPGPAVGADIHGQASRPISAGRLSASPRVHRPSIEVVVCDRP